MPKPAETPARRPPSRLLEKHEEKRRHPLRALILILLILPAAGIAAFYFFVLKPPSAAPLPYVTEAALSTRPGVYSFLLAGQRDGLTDTLMAGLLDTKKGVLNLVSIPRDTVTANKRAVPKINGAYLQGGKGEEGIARLLAETSQILGFTPDNYVLVDMEAFIALVDALGGVDFDVPEDLSLPSEGIHLAKGPQLLDGEQALQLVRYRSYTKAAGVGLSDFGRMEVQHRFLRATAETALSQLSLPLVQTLGEIAADYGQTNLASGQFAWLAWTLWRMGTDNIHFETLPTNSVRYGDDMVHNLYYEQVDSAKALIIINEYLNPYREEITASMVSHRVLGS